MGNTYARLWDASPVEKRHFDDPPFLDEFCRCIRDFVTGFVQSYPELAVLRFHAPITWNTLIYEDDFLAFKYPLPTDVTKTSGYVSNGESGTALEIKSEENFDDEVPHLRMSIDAENRRLFTCWTLQQLANVLTVTEKTWANEIVSVLYSQPDPIGRIFGDKYDIGDIHRLDMLEVASKHLRAMQEKQLEEAPYAQLYMLLQQFDLFYLYRRMFMKYPDESYIDPNLPYLEVQMLTEMARYGDDAPLLDIMYYSEPATDGWPAPIHRQIYGDVDYVLIVLHDGQKRCVTVNVGGIYENGLLEDLDDPEAYGIPKDTNIPTLVMWLSQNDDYFRTHFVRAAQRFETRREIEREERTKGAVNQMDRYARPGTYITMDKREKFLLREHLRSNPMIVQKAGYWSYLRQVRKNEYSANKMLYVTMCEGSGKAESSKTDAQTRADEERKMKFLNQPTIESDVPVTQPLAHRFPLAKQQENGEPSPSPEDFAYDPQSKSPSGFVIKVPESATENPLFWPIYRIHRLLRWGCTSSIVAAAGMITKPEFLLDKNAEYFHQFPIVEVALNVLEINRREYGKQKFELLDMLTTMCQSPFLLKQIGFYNGIRAILEALRSRFLEVRIAASVCLTTLQYLVSDNRQLIGREGGMTLLVDTMRCPEVADKDYWCHGYSTKHERVWPEEILRVCAAQAAAAVFLAVKDRRNRVDFVTLGGVEVCKNLLQKGHAAEYTAMPVIGILSEIAYERSFHKRILESGAFKAACHTLKHTNNEDVIQNACTFLSIMCDFDAAREAARSAGCLEALLKPLKTASFWSNEGCLKACISAVYKCAVSVVSCEVFLKENVINLCLDRLYAGCSEGTAHNVLAVLAEMARTESGRIQIRGSGALPFIIDFLRYHNQFIRMKAALCVGRTGADKDGFAAVVDSGAILQIWHLFSTIYAPIVNVHACMAIYPLYVAQPRETAKIIRSIINPIGPFFDLFRLQHPRVTDAVLNLMCVLTTDNDLLAMMTDMDFCKFVAPEISTRDVRKLQLVTEVIARGCEYAVNRINFSHTDVPPKMAKLLWHKDDGVQANALHAIHELTKYPQNIIQIHSDRVVRRLLSYLMEGADDRARTASGCLKHMRYLAMANMGDTYNFEDTYFPLQPELKKAIQRTKKELLLRKIAPEAKRVADEMRTKMKLEKKARMRPVPHAPPEKQAKKLRSNVTQLPDILRPADEADVEDRRGALSQQLAEDGRKNVIESSDQIRRDRNEDDWPMPVPIVRTSGSPDFKEDWWLDDFNDDNYQLFNRLTITDNYLCDNVDESLLVRSSDQ